MQKDNLKQLSSEELAFFAGQISLMLESGIPLYESIEIFRDNYSDTTNADAFSSIYTAVENGKPFSEAIEESGIFPFYASQMINVGENTGKLEQVLKSLSKHYMREHNLNVSVKNSVRYPLMLLSIMAAVVLILNIKVMPLFKDVLANIGGTASNLTELTMKAGSIIGYVALAIIILISLTAVILLLLVKNGKKDSAVNAIIRFVPSLKKLSRAIAAERFLSVLAISLQAGYPPESAAEACAHLIDDTTALESINRIIAENNSTGSLAEAICDSDLFEPLKSKMLKIGFMTGKQDEVTAKVADLYSTETDEKLEKLLSLIEPVLVAVLAVVIGCILLAIMLPLAGLMTSML